MAITFESIGKRCGVSRLKASADIEQARIALTKDFVPNYLGFENLSRELLLRNTTVLSRMLHAQNDPEKLIIILDGTYIFIDKSANHEFQKLSFNGQKNRNFVRPMMCVTTNGYIIDVFGPFEAVKNDAKCMITILENNSDIPNVMQPGDIFVFDRGFRDCEDNVKNLGYEFRAPEFVQRNHPTQQLTTEQANRSRLVTKTRYVVEARNGHLKTIFPVFARQWSTVLLAHLGEDLRIAAAVINKYFANVVADKGQCSGLHQSKRGATLLYITLFYILCYD